MKFSEWMDDRGERLLFGLLIIGGYYVLVIVGIHATKDTISPTSLSIIHDAMLTGGPLVGIIVNAIWKKDASDKQNAQTAATLATVVASQNPTEPNPTPAPQGPTP